MNSTRKTKITVAGQLSDPQYHRAAAIARGLGQKCSQQVDIEIKEFFETQWRQHLFEVQNEKKGTFYEHRGSPLVYINDEEYIGDCTAFAKWALHTYHFQDSGKLSDYEA